MAKTKLKSVFTREDVYTVLQLLKALADGVDTNEELTDADIEKLKASINKLNGAVNIAEDNTVTIANGIVIKPTADVDIGHNLDVDGNLKLNSPDNLKFVTGSLSGKKYYNHKITLITGTGSIDKMKLIINEVSEYQFPITSWSTMLSQFGSRNPAFTGVMKNSTYSGGCIGYFEGGSNPGNTTIHYSYPNSNGIVDDSMQWASFGGYDTIDDVVTEL